MKCQQNNIFIDPENCGSSVGYYITVNEYNSRDRPVVYTIHANIVLADCTHMIGWTFNDGEGVEKIDAAIAMLQEFKKKFIETEKLVKRLNRLDHL
jgi:hypothetical protein